MSERLTKEEVELAADERFGLTTPMMVRLARELLEARQQLAAAPARHDKPTCAGWWCCRYNSKLGLPNPGRPVWKLCFFEDCAAPWITSTYSQFYGPIPLPTQDVP